MDKNNKQYIKISYWNANSLKDKKTETLEFLMNNKIDIFLVSETKYSQNSNINIQGYNCVNKNRIADNIGGGVAIYVAKNIQYNEIAVDTKTFESVAVKVGDIILACIYNTPDSSKYKNKLPPFEPRELEKIFGLGGKVLICGDFNAKHTNWNCFRNDGQGIKLQQYLNTTDFTLEYPNRHTLFPSSGAAASTVDLTINKNSNISTLEVFNELSSDHLPVAFKIYKHNVQQIEKKLLDYKNADWSKFRNTLTAFCVHGSWACPAG